MPELILGRYKFYCGYQLHLTAVNRSDDGNSGEVFGRSTTFIGHTDCYRHIKIETWGQFHQRSTSSFCARRSQKHKKDSQVKELFGFWDL